MNLLAYLSADSLQPQTEEQKNFFFVCWDGVELMCVFSKIRILGGMTKMTRLYRCAFVACARVFFFVVS